MPCRSLSWLRRAKAARRRTGLRRRQDSVDTTRENGRTKQSGHSKSEHTGVEPEGMCETCGDLRGGRGRGRERPQALSPR
eukprot:2794329-Rhodomonas_salina.1